MSGIDRREFLKRSALAGGALTLGGAMRPSFASRFLDPHLAAEGSILDLPAAESPIDTIVVLMMENRSIDHYLGWLATDNAYIAAGQSRYGAGFSFDADNTQSFLNTDGEAVGTYHYPTRGGDNPYRGCEHPDPGHGWNHGRAQRDGGFLAAGSGNDEFALSYYLAEDVPLYANLARRFTTFDRYHCSLLAPTYPNRLYMHSAQSGGEKTNRLPIAERGHSWPIIWEKLAAANVPSAYYFVDLPAILLFGARTIPFTRHIERFFADAAAGQLPRVVFLDPGFTTGMRTDDHPYADIRAGQKFVLDVLKAFVESPHWQRGAFFITYDEWGGFFDHVAPPLLPDSRASGNDAENFGQAGFRVPTLMASPYAQPGFVDHRLYDHTSILRFIEWRYLGAPAEGSGGAGWWLTARDQNAANIGASLSSTLVDAEMHLPVLPEVPIASPPCEGEELEGTGVGAAVEMHAFEQALHLGYFERVGFTPDLRPYPISSGAVPR